MAIYLNARPSRDLPNQDAHGGYTSLYADTKAEIEAEDETVSTVNAGDVVCVPGSNCVTKLGEVLLLDSAGAWAEI